MLASSILSFSTMFFKALFLSIIKSQDCGWYDLRTVVLKSQLLQFNPHLLYSFRNKPWFFRLCSISLLKTLWKKEKLLVTSNFPHCFLPFWETFCYFHETSNFCLQTLSVWKSPKCVIWERVNSWICIQYSPTILKNIVSLVLQTFLYLEAFDCITTSDWLKHMV